MTITCPGPGRASECENPGCRRGGCQGRYPAKYAWLIAAALLMPLAAWAEDTQHSDPAYQAALHLMREADPVLSPGWDRDDMTVAEMCAKKWGKDERAVTDAMKRQVYAAYGVAILPGQPFPHYVINGKSRPLYEVDHVHSRELLGADDLRNLALQSYVGDCNAHDKDRTENALHKDVCAGAIDLPDAWLRLNRWIAEFERRWGSCRHPEQE